MRGPIRAHVLEETKLQILMQRDNALQSQSVYREESTEYAYWQGAYEWLNVAAQIIDESMEVS